MYNTDTTYTCICIIHIHLCIIINTKIQVCINTHVKSVYLYVYVLSFDENYDEKPMLQGASQMPSTGLKYPRIFSNIVASRLEGIFKYI